jgi:hypothetical protein
MAEAAAIVTVASAIVEACVLGDALPATPPTHGVSDD